MPRKDRVTMDMSPASAAALRTYASKHGIRVRDAAGDMASLIDGLIVDIDGLRDKLAASEEARQKALKCAGSAGRERDEASFELAGARGRIAALQQIIALRDARDDNRNDDHMTAWDHLRAARAKAPFLVGFLFGIPPGCVAVAAAIAMGVLG